MQVLSRLRAHVDQPGARWSLIVVAGLVVLHLVAWLSLLGLQRSHVDAVLSGVEVDGGSVGGLERPRLLQVIDARGDERLAETVRITAAADAEGDAAEAGGDPEDRPTGSELETDRAEIGVGVDATSTADDAWAQGRRGLWRALADQIRVRLGATLSVPLAIDVDDDHLADWAEEAAAELSVEPRSGAITFVAGEPPDDADVEITSARQGIEVAGSELAELTRDRVTAALGPVHIEAPATAVAPAVTDDDVAAVAADAELAVSGPVELENPSPADDLILSPVDLALVLTVEADPEGDEGSRLRITTDADRLADHLGDQRIDALGPGSVDAFIDLSDGVATVDGGTEGFELDLDATADAVVELATQESPRAGDLPGDTSLPTVTVEDAELVLPAAEVLVSDDVVLTNPSDAADLQLTPEDLAAVLEVSIDVDALDELDADDPVANDATDPADLLQVSSSGEALTDHLGEEGVEELETSPVELDIALVDGSLSLEGGTPGFSFDADAAAEVVVELASQDPTEDQDADRTGALPGDVTQPDPSRQSLEEAGIEEVVSSFTTSLVAGQSRNTNIHLAADHIHGDVIEPGATYSLNDGIGPRTADRGFVENGYIEDGDLISVTGGGVSQMGTTFMNAAWFAGIQIHEFHPHSLYFQRYPMGREATLAWGTLDVVVENDSPHSIMILTSHTSTSVTVAFASTSWASVDSWTGSPTNTVPGNVRDGFDIEFGRDITYPDGSTSSESYSHRYQPEN